MSEILSQSQIDNLLNSLTSGNKDIETDITEKKKGKS